MKQFFFAALFSFVAGAGFAQQKELSKPDPAKKTDTAEAACGQCQFHMKGKGCTLAVRRDGKSHFVDGTDIDSHGDAHADDGFCNKVRKAKVQGEVVDGRFKATYFELLPKQKKKGQT
jgi:hypothetical protein